MSTAPKTRGRPRKVPSPSRDPDLDRYIASVKLTPAAAKVLDLLTDGGLTAVAAINQVLEHALPSVLRKRQDEAERAAKAAMAAYEEHYQAAQIADECPGSR